MAQDEPSASRKRERSNRYPGRSLAESVELARSLADRGLDGFPATEIAQALGYSNVKTNAFSASLSAARQFGLIEIKDEGYALTSLAKAILHPVEPAELPAIYRKALLLPPLYTDLAARLADKKVPESAILANVLYHQHQITATAKDAAAETFLESAKFAGALGPDGIFRPQGAADAPTKISPSPSPNLREAVTAAPAVSSAVEPRSTDVYIDLRLRGEDAGKRVRMKVPESISRESYERLLAALLLHIQVVDAPESAS